MTIAIIGAGIAGLSAAKHLLTHGKSVRIFEKSRGVGGRMATRYAGAWEFDHGVQYFTVQDDAFNAEIEAAQAAGVIAPWQARGLYLDKTGISEDRGRPRFVGIPRMNSLPKFLASALDIELNRRVANLSKGTNWDIHFEDGTIETGFEAVISTVPAAQAKTILPKTSALLDQIDDMQMQACFSLMIGLNHPLDLSWDTLRVKDLPIDWISNNGAKPGRNKRIGALLITSEASWSDRHKDADRDWVKRTMLDAASAITDTALYDAPHQDLHRWLYASNRYDTELEFMSDDGIIVCGDWCKGGRVQGAWLSGRAAAHTFL